MYDNLKNLPGWRTSRKIVAFAVDDYCNVRLASQAARDRLGGAGLDLTSRFDRVDAMETREDLEALFDALDSVEDAWGRPPVITAYAVSANPDFDRLRRGAGTYTYEPVPDTFARLAAEQPGAYEGAWDLWHEGRAAGWIQPQFHGREHLNVELIERKLAIGAMDLNVNVDNQSMAALRGDPSLPGLGFTEAFGLSTRSSLPSQREILEDGLQLFRSVWGFSSSTFTPPAHALHPSLRRVAESGGVNAIHKPLYCARPMGDGTRRHEFNRSGPCRGEDHTSVVRNVVFEPGSGGVDDSVDLALRQIAAAFRWSKPAIVSSHRVNFSGHVDESNRKSGLDALRVLLGEVTRRWPEVEFLSVDALVDQMSRSEVSAP